MKGQFLYLVINLFALFSVSYQISALSVKVEGTNLYKMDEQIIYITFDTDISVSKVNAVMTRDSITSITGDCTEIKTKPKVANCSFDLTSVTPGLTYNLKIKYNNIDLSSTYSFTVNFVVSSNFSLKKVILKSENISLSRKTCSDSLLKRVVICIVHRFRYVKRQNSVSEIENRISVSFFLRRGSL